MSSIDVAREDIEAFNAGDWERFKAPQCSKDGADLARAQPRVDRDQHAVRRRYTMVQLQQGRHVETQRRDAVMGPQPVAA
jgi:hypothetical protein